ncbi:unnamed protein product [Urochloa decumbens]|uniref:F-box domain-containing protein n=1 Tax=Urochloa decumbens TaxID=240449 RepID=A0ABC9D860_9POAL
MAAECGQQHESDETQVGDLPEVCLALAIALTSPRDAARCAAVSPAFRAAADSDHVWGRFIPTSRSLPLLQQLPRSNSKAAYLGLCDAGAVVDDGDGGGGGPVRAWLEKATGARCYALSARRLSLPWDDGEFCWRFKPHPLSRRFAEVAELVECTCLDIYGRLPAAALTPATPYAAYLVYGTVEGRRRGLSFPDQEASVAVGGRVVARHAVCLCPDEAEARKFRAGGAVAGGAGAAVRQPRRRDDGWWEMEMGRFRLADDDDKDDATDGEEAVVTANFEVMGWYPKRGLVVEAMEFRPLRG